MGTTVGGAGVVREEGAERRRVTVLLSELAFEALTGDDGDADPSLRMENALLCYLGDSDSGKPAWSYPSFLRGTETRREVQVEVEVAPDLWRKFEEEAVRQGVTVEQMTEHAAFYFAAELDAGRVTQRILDDLASEGGASD